MKIAQSFRAVLLLLAVSLMTFLTLGVMTASAADKPGQGMYFVIVTHGGDDPFFSVVNHEGRCRPVGSEGGHRSRQW